MPSIEELEQQAASFSQQKDIQSTERVCREILALNENHMSSLRFLADRALQTGNFSEAEAHLKVMIANSPGNLQLRSQLGQVFYRQGKLQEAVTAYEDYRRMNPRKSIIHLTLGCLHLELGNTEQAAQVFSLGEAVDANLLSLWKKPDTDAAVAQMSKKAWQTVSQHHTDMHFKAVQSSGDPSATTRIRDAVWPLIDAREFSYAHPKHRPQIFSIQYAENPRFFDGGAFPWRDQLEQQYPTIRDEILTALDVAVDGKPYLKNSHRLQGEQWEPLVNRMSWASVHLYSRGVGDQQVIRKFPRTMAALEQVPLATTEGNPSEVFISVLAPRTRIPEHFGVSSAILTAHLPIDVPPDCGLKVHDETRSPEAGKLMVFDDTWEHSAWNNSDKPRVVLIFELWHPELTEQEKDAIACSFRARENWLRQRRAERTESAPDVHDAANSEG